VASYFAETGAEEGGRVAGERRTGRRRGVEGIGFEGKRSGGARGAFRGFAERGGHARSAALRTHVETGDTPNEPVVRRAQFRAAFQINERRTRRKLAPADGRVSVEGEQAGRRSGGDESADEQSFERGPEFFGERPDGEFGAHGVRITRGVIGVPTARVAA